MIRQRCYCSPERLEKGLSDTQTDLWSIAVVLYEMVAGSLPFHASSHQQLELLITSGAPPAALPESVPRNLQAIIYKALSTNVENRYPDARAFADDLHRNSAWRRMRQRRERRSRRPKTPPAK